MEDEKATILIVEDEESIRKFININLSRVGYNVIEAETGEAALAIVNTRKLDIIVLDVMLSGISGIDVVKAIRAKKAEVAIIMLTAKTQDIDKIEGLESGADDYMVKPFNPMELIARIKSILRRTKIQPEDNQEIIQYKNMTMDLRSQSFLLDDKKIDLTPTEFAILKVFLKNPGKAINRNDLLTMVWGKNFYGDIKTVDVYVRRLREKVETNPSQPTVIETVWGFGYRLKQD